MVAITRRSVGCGLTDESYDQVMKMAARRGITVSELVRHYIEEGLSNPTPREIRRLTDRLSTIETAIKELYEMALVNWAQVEKPPKEEPYRAALPWMPGFLDDWKKTLDSKGMLNEKTGQTAYEELVQREQDWQTEDLPEDEEDIQAYLREMWKADGSWTEDEEARFQEARKRVPKYTRAKKTTTRKSTRKPKAKSDSATKPASQKRRNRGGKSTPKGSSRTRKKPES